MLWHCPSDALPSRHALSRHPSLTQPHPASEYQPYFLLGKLRHRALPTASQPPCKCQPRGSSGTKAVPVNPPYPLLCKPLILPLQLFQMFSPPPSCWVAQEASVPLSAGFSFQVSAKPITSMGAAPLSSLQAATAASKNYRSSHAEKYRGIYAILEGFWSSWEGFWPPWGIVAHPRDVVPEELEAEGNNILILAVGKGGFVPLQMGQ